MKKLTVALGVFAVAFIAACRGNAPSPASRDADKMPVLQLASWGGSFQDELDRAVVQPTAASVHLRAHITAYSGEYDRLAATIRDNTNTLDLVHVESSFLKQGGREHLLAPMDWQVIQKDRFVPGATDDYGVAALAWSLVLSWNTSRLPAGGVTPTSWSDFFDTGRFPGPRCMRKVPEGNLELALLADGVAPDKIYEGGQLDIERALRKLSTIKKNIAWWSSGAELEQKLTSDCSLAAGWDGRVQNLKSSAGVPVDFTYQGGINQYDWWVVPVNAAHKAEAMTFLNALGAGLGQQTIAEKFGYGPVAKAALDSFPPALRSHISSAPENVARGVNFNADWWATNQAAVTERWNRWLLEQ